MIFDRVGLGKVHGDGVPDMRKGFQTRSGERGSRQGVGFLTWRWGSRHGYRVPDMGMGFQTGDGGTRHRWGSRHEMMGYQTEDEVPVRGRVTFTTFTSHQSGILHSLIFCLYQSNQRKNSILSEHVFLDPMRYDLYLKLSRSNIPELQLHQLSKSSGIRIASSFHRNGLSSFKICFLVRIFRYSTT